MRSQKNIDRLFQENLKDFEVYPPNNSWNRIEKRIVQNPTRRRIPLWLRFASIAALLLLLLTIGLKYEDFSNASSINDFISSTKSDNDDAPAEDINTTKKNIELKSNDLKLTNRSNTANAKIPAADDHIGDFEQNSSNSTDENSNHSKEYSDNTLADTRNLPLKSFESDPVQIEGDAKKWTIAPIFAPIYFSSFNSKGSPIDNQFQNNPVQGQSTFSYGVKIAYQLNNKFSVQSGVSLINLGYKTNNVYFAPGVAIIGMSNISNVPFAQGLQNEPTGKNTAVSSKNESDNGLGTDNKGSLNQLFGYVEIPMEIKYHITNGKLSFNLVGGFSTLLLNKNEVLIQTSEFTTSLGEANNLRDINFSGNIGVDVDYLIRKNLYINIAPMLKIQTNTFSKSSAGFQPYFLGVYTGVNYKF